MLKISRLTDYASSVVLYLQNCESLQSTEAIASAVSVEMPTASKILKLLVKAKILTSVRGANGGYRMNKVVHEVTLYDVIVAIEGAAAITECSKSDSHCAQQTACDTRSGWQQVNNEIINILSAMTIERMAELNGTSKADVPIMVKDYVGTS